MKTLIRLLILLTFFVTMSAFSQTINASNRRGPRGIVGAHLASMVGDVALIVTHAGRAWDPYENSKAEIERISQEADFLGLPIFFLYSLDGGGSDTYFFPTHIRNKPILAPTGYFKPPFTGKHFVIMGGQFLECLAETVEGLISRHQESAADKPLTITILTNGTYVAGGALLEDVISKQKDPSQKRKMQGVKVYPRILFNINPDLRYEMTYNDEILVTSESTQRTGNPIVRIQLISKEYKPSLLDVLQMVP